MGREEAITVSVTHSASVLKEIHKRAEPYLVTLEAVKVADQPLPRYRQLGYGFRRPELALRVGAYVDQGDYDALLE